VQNLIQLHVLIAVQVKSQTKAVPNVLNVTLVKRELEQTVHVNHAHWVNTVQVK
jgi:hypothetical protein